MKRQWGSRRDTTLYAVISDSKYTNVIELTTADHGAAVTSCNAFDPNHIAWLYYEHVDLIYSGIMFINYTIMYN